VLDHKTVMHSSSGYLEDTPLVALEDRLGSPGEVLGVLGVGFGQCWFYTMTWSPFLNGGRSQVDPECALTGGRSQVCSAILLPIIWLYSEVQFLLP